MKIEIKEENNKHLLQCVYLGNLIINGYRKAEETKTEYVVFVEDILKQIIKAVPQPESRYSFKFMPNEKSDDRLLSDLYDRIEDSVKPFYDDYRKALLSELLADG